MGARFRRQIALFIPLPGYHLLHRLKCHDEKGLSERIMEELERSGAWERWHDELATRDQEAADRR